jgi:DNA-binding transcriptional MerR regulator
MSIGQVAQICELAPSAIRYYEKAGLLPKPIRVSRQRRYGAEVIGRLRLLLSDDTAGASLAGTRQAQADGNRSADGATARHEAPAGIKLSLPLSEHRGLRADHCRGIACRHEGAPAPFEKGKTGQLGEASQTVRSTRLVALVVAGPKLPAWRWPLRVHETGDLLANRTLQRTAVR